MKTNKFIFLCLFSWIWIASIACYAQEQKTWQWVSQLGSRSWDLAGGIVCNSNNKLYVTGSFIDTLVCENKRMASVGSQDIFVARLNQKGNLEYLLSAGGPGFDQASCLAVSKDNSIVIGGNITDSVAFDDFTLKEKGNRICIASLSDKGKFSWIYTLAKSGMANLFLIGSDATGSVYAAGIFKGSLGSGDQIVKSNGKKDIFLLKIKENGTLEKLISLGGIGDDIPTAISVSDSGKILLAGTTGVSFNTGNIKITAAKQHSNSELNSEAFILCFNDNFEVLWKNQISGEEYCEVSSLGQDRLGNIYASGSFNLSINTGDTLLISRGYADGFLLKYNMNGNKTWARSFGSCYNDYARDVVIDNMNGAMITGSLGDTMIVDSLNVIPLSENNSALVVQFSPLGKVIWADCISGSGRSFGNETAIDSEGNLYLTGTFRESFSKGSASITAIGDQDVFIAKHYNCSNSKADIIGNPVICPGETTLLSVKPGYNQVIWNDTISGTDYINVNRPGMHTVTMLDKRGCKLNDTIEVVNAHISSFTLGPDLQLSIDETLILKAPHYYSKFLWQDGSTDTTFAVKAQNEKPGLYTYWLSATDSLGCLVTDTININFYQGSIDYNPGKVEINVFPNPVGDILNWSVTTEKNGHFIIEVADANGKVVYNTKVRDYESNTPMTIDFSDVPSGPYYMCLKNNAGEIYHSICIIRK